MVVPVTSLLIVIDIGPRSGGLGKHKVLRSESVVCLSSTIFLSDRKNLESLNASGFRRERVEMVTLLIATQFTRAVRMDVVRISQQRPGRDLRRNRSRNYACDLRRHNSGCDCCINKELTKLGQFRTTHQTENLDPASVHRLSVFCILPIPEVPCVEEQAKHIWRNQRPLFWCNVYGENANHNAICERQRPSLPPLPTHFSH